MITFQDIFNAAWEEFIIKDNPPAVEPTKYSYSCKYLTKDGRKCAIGLCLPTNLDTKGTNNSNMDVTFGELIVRYPDLFDCKSSTDATDFQKDLHDDLVNMKTGQWNYTKDARKQNYINVARKFNLTIPEPTL